MEEGGVWEGLDCEVVHPAGVHGLRRALKDGGVIVANSMRAALLTSLVAPRRSTLVYWVRDGLTDSAMSPTALAVTKHVTAPRTKHYFANSHWTASTVQKAMRVGPERLDVIYSMCGVTSTASDRHPRSTPHPPLRLLFLGRISPWKAPHLAVNTLAHLRALGVKATLTIAGAAHFGESEYEARVASLAAEDPAVTMLGHVQDVQPLLESHDVLLHTSTTPEPFGQVIVQGLAAGMPVLATDMGGPVEILDGAPTRLLYPPGDVAELASGIQRVVRHYAEVSLWSTVRSRDFSDTRLTIQVDEALARITAAEDQAGSLGRLLPPTEETS